MAENLAIYAQPRMTAKPAGETGPSAKPPARGGIGMSPVGSIGAAPPTIVGGFVSALAADKFTAS